MTTKAEEKMKKFLNDQLNDHLNIINERLSGVLLYGFISGIIMSYSGFLSYFAGIVTGIIISRKYTYISYQITEKVSYLFQNVLNKSKNI